MKTSAPGQLLKLTFGFVLLASGLEGAAAAPGDEHWDRQFGWAGVTNTVFGLGFRDGRLYAGGVLPGGDTNNQVDIWDGTNWSVLPGLSGSLTVVYDLAWVGTDLY